MVNLNASLYHSTTCIDNSLQRNEYQEVLRVRVFYSNKRIEKRLDPTRGSDLKRKDFKFWTDIFEFYAETQFQIHVPWLES